MAPMSLEEMPTYSEYSKQEEEDQFVSMPVLGINPQTGPKKRYIFVNHAYLVISDLEQD
jgi:hypothetical protein